MTVLEKHHAFLNSQVGNPYIYGGEGQVATVAFITAHATGSNRTNALKIRQRQLDKGIPQDKILCWDCSGLPTEDLIKRKVIPGDMNANGMKGKCRIISKDQVVPGCLCFRVEDTNKNKKNDAGDRAHHVGTCVAVENGVPIIIHAKGHAWGVVREGIEGSGKSYWELFGVPKWFENEITTGETEEEIMLKKGDKGQPVYDFQCACKRAKYDVGTWADLFLKGANGKPLPTGCDGELGPHMVTVINAIQKKHGLPQTGFADAATYGRLVSEIKDMDTSALDKQIAALKAAFDEDTKAFKQIGEIAAARMK